MNIDRPIEDRITVWLKETAPGGLPDRVLESTFGQTRSMAQTSGVLRWKLAGVLRFPILFAAGVIVVVVIALTVGFRNTGPSQVGAPSSVVVPKVWTTDDGVAVRIVRDPADDFAYYWRAQAYDEIDLRSMSDSTTRTTERAPAASVFDGM